MRQASFALLIAGTLLAGCASSPRTADRPEPPKLMGWDEFVPLETETVWLGGQPGDDALDRFAAESAGRGGLVINLRTDEEMAYLPYYDRAVAARGLRYVRIPTSGSTLGAETLAAYEEAVRGTDGPVMLHCASGGRASYLWAMHRMAHEGLTGEQAVAWFTEVRGSEPSEKGRELLLTFDPDRAPE
jgi:uncharacterized protein (TIGR01244 family)